MGGKGRIACLHNLGRTLAVKQMVALENRNRLYEEKYFMHD